MPRPRDRLRPRRRTATDFSVEISVPALLDDPQPSSHPVLHNEVYRTPARHSTAANSVRPSDEDPFFSSDDENTITANPVTSLTESALTRHIANMAVTAPAHPAPVPTDLEDNQFSRYINLTLPPRYPSVPSEPEANLEPPNTLIPPSYPRNSVATTAMSRPIAENYPIPVPNPTRRAPRRNSEAPLTNEENPRSSRFQRRHDSFLSRDNSIPPPYVANPLSNILLSNELLESYDLPSDLTLDSEGKIEIDTDLEAFEIIRKLCAKSAQYQGVLLNIEDDQTAVIDNSLRQVFHSENNSDSTEHLHLTRVQQHQTHDSQESIQTASTRSLTTSEREMIDNVGSRAYQTYLTGRRHRQSIRFGHPVRSPTLVFPSHIPTFENTPFTDPHHYMLPSARHSHGVRVRSYMPSTLPSRPPGPFRQHNHRPARSLSPSSQSEEF